MGEHRSIFSEEWRACLRAHYTYVIRAQDALTEQTLRHVLLQTGMREDELADMRRQALGYDPYAASEAEIDAPQDEDEPVNKIFEQVAPPPAAVEEPPADLVDTPSDNAPDDVLDNPVDTLPDDSLDNFPDAPPDEDDSPPTSSSQLSMF